MKLYFDVPYEDRNEVKSLGAHWDNKVKKWCIDSEPEDYIKFAKWILGDSRNNEALMIYLDIYLIEGKVSCYRCGKTTKVFGFGFQDYINIYGDWDNDGNLIDSSIEIIEGDDLHLVKIPDEKYIPPLLLKYLTNNYSFKYFQGEKIFNICSHCGIKQKSSIYWDYDNSLASYSDHVDELVIKSIDIDDAFILNEWDYSWCSSDDAYLFYSDGTEVVYLIENSDKDSFSYEDMYLLN